MSPTTTVVPAPSGPDVVVDLPIDGGGHSAVVHVPADLLSELAPDHGTSVADWMTGGGTVVLALGTAVLAGVAVVAAFFARAQVKVAHSARQDALRARHAETLSYVTQAWNNPSLRNVRATMRCYRDSEGSPEGLADKMFALRAASDPQYWKLLTALDFFEVLAMLINCDAIPRKMAVDALGNVTCEYWDMLRPFVFRQRKQTPRDNHYYTEFQSLAQDISKALGLGFEWEDEDDGKVQESNEIAEASPSQAPTAAVEATR